MSGIENRMRRLEQEVGRLTPIGDAAYWSALRRTNGTGLATRADYALTQAGLAAEVRADCCAQAPFIHAVAAAGVEVSGLATIAAVPPDEQLPEASCAQLDEVSRVVHEVPEPPVSHDYRAYRIECATWSLALGDDRGLSIRGMVWERLGDGWRHTGRVESLAKSSGMAAVELGWWSQRYPQLVPAWDHPDVQERLSGTGHSGLWISWWDLADIVHARAAEPRSDPVNSGHDDGPA